MPLPSKPVIFETLTQKKQRPCATNQFELFPELCADTDPTNTDYWYYSDLYNLFGPAYTPIEPNMNVHVWQNLVMPTPQKSKRSFPQLASTTLDFYNQHIATIRHEYTIGKTKFKNAKDLKVSRYAAWCLCRQNPYMIFARTYFISPAISENLSFQEICRHSYQFARIYLRQQLSSREKTFNAIIHNLHGDHNTLNQISTNAMFDGISIRELKNINHIQNKPHDPLSNYMGAATLNARTIAIDNTIRRFNQSNIKTIDALCEILYDELTHQRIKTTTDTGIRPTNDIFSIHISQVQSLLMRTERDFILKYSDTRVK